MSIYSWWQEKQDRIDKNSALADLIHSETGAGVVNRDAVQDYIKQGGVVPQAMATQKVSTKFNIKKYRYLASAALGIYFALKKGK